MTKTCCCTGHKPRPDRSGHKYYAYLLNLEDKIEYVIRKYGVTNFISGLSYGIDMDFAEIVLSLREKYPEITLECAFPLPYEFNKWNFGDKDRIMKKSAKVTVVSDKVESDWILRHIQYLVDNSDIVITTVDGDEANVTRKLLDYAKRTNKIIEAVKV